MIQIKQQAKQAAGLIGSISLIIGTAFLLDGRYFHADAAERAASAEERAHIELRESAELKDMRTQMKLSRLRLGFLLGKQKKTPDDVMEIESIREEMKIAAARVAELQR